MNKASVLLSRPTMPEAAAPRVGARARMRGRWRAVLTTALVLLVLALVAWRAQTIPWHEVGAALRGYGVATLGAAALLAAVGHALYSCFDLIARAWLRLAVPARRAMAITFVSYAFNLNLGPWVGAVALRFRLYARAGLNAATTTRVLGISILTNWLGYVALAGAVFSARAAPLPADWDVGASALQALGVGLLALAVAYVGACAFARRRRWHFRRWHVTLPPLRIALAQLALGCANWTLMASIIWVLLGGTVGFATVLAVLLTAAIAGVLTHLPAGLGVIEAVFFAMLGARVGEASLLAALLTYRALYYLAPLVVALATYLTLEALARRAGEGTRKAGAA